MAASQTKKILLVVGSVLAIAASGAWIYFHEFKAPKHDVALHRWIGEVMAQETATLITTNRHILLLTIPDSSEPELKTQVEAFRAKLEKLGKFKIEEEGFDPKDQDKYGLGSGLSGRRFVRTLNKNLKTAVAVSFIGAPKVADQQIAELKHRPKFVAETRSLDALPQLFEKKLIDVAVVSRFNFPAPGPAKPKTPQEWFEKRYQIVRAADVAKLPPPE